MNKSNTCPACDGDGMLWSFPCPNCIGRGEQSLPAERDQSAMRMPEQSIYLDIQFFQQSNTLKPYFFKVYRFTHINRTNCFKAAFDYLDKFKNCAGSYLCREWRKAVQCFIRLFPETIGNISVKSLCVVSVLKRCPTYRMPVGVAAVYKSFERLKDLQCENSFSLSDLLSVRCDCSEVCQHAPKYGSKARHKSFPLRGLRLQWRRRIKRGDVSKKSTDQQTTSHNSQKLVSPHPGILCCSNSSKTIAKVEGEHNA